MFTILIHCSLSQPLIFPHSSIQVESNASSANQEMGSQKRSTDASQTVGPQLSGLGRVSEPYHPREQDDRVVHNGVHVDRPPSHTQSDEHETIHNWLRNSQEDSFRTGTSFVASEDIRSSNLSVSELVNKFQQSDPYQGSVGFVPVIKSSDFVSGSDSVSMSYPSTAVPIRPPQHGNSQSANQIQPQFVSSNSVHDRSFDSARSANQREDHSFPERFAQSLPARGKNSPTSSHQSKG
jgi:hypothetical protein